MDDVTKQLNRLCANEAKGKVQLFFWLDPALIEHLLDRCEPLIQRLAEVMAAEDMHKMTGIPTFEDWVKLPVNHRWFTNHVATQTRKGIPLPEVSKQVREKYFDDYPLVRPKEGRPQNEERYVVARLIERCLVKSLDSVLQDLTDEAAARDKTKEKPRSTWDNEKPADSSTDQGDERLSKVGA